MNDTVAVVVTYNRKDLLRECLQALSAQTRPCDILVIDNHSTDGTDQFLQSWKDRQDEGGSSNNGLFDFIRTEQNVGGAGGFSCGMREAVRRGYRYCWVMDDDSIAQPDCLEKLCAAGASLQGNYGFLVSKAVWMDGKLCTMNLTRDTLKHALTDVGHEPQRVIIGSFVSMLIPTERIRERGLPIKEFFIWVDDWEYSRRLSKQDPCYLVPESVVVHKTKDNQGADIVKETGERIERYRYMYRNSVYFYRQEGLYGILYLICRTLLHMGKVILCSKGNKGRKLGIIIKGSLEGLRMNPVIEYVDGRNG